MNCRIPFTVQGGPNLGGTAVLVPAKPGYRVELEAIYVSQPQLSSGGPYTDQYTVYGFEDPVTGLPSVPNTYNLPGTDIGYGSSSTLQFQLQRASSGGFLNFTIPVSGRTPCNFGLNVIATDGSSGSNLTSPVFTVCGVYTKD